MSDEQTTTPDEAPQAEQPEQPVPEQVDESNPNAEAAKYRRKLRDTEAERDALVEQVDTLRRAAVDKIAKDRGIEPAAFWAAGNQVADLLDEEGKLDEDRVREGIETAVRKLGLKRFPAPVVRHEGRTTEPKTNTWAAAFAPE